MNLKSNNVELQLYRGIKKGERTRQLYSEQVIFHPSHLALVL